MVSTLRHKRSPAKTLNLPFPASSEMIDAQTSGESSSSGSLAPADGYSSLFASGFLKQPYHDPAGPSPTLSLFPSPPKDLRGPFHPSPERSPEKPSFDAYTSPVKSSFLSPSKQSPRRRSSAMHTTPSSVSPRKVKMGGPDGGVERALDNVMRSLKGMAMGTPRWGEQAESRWSSSSEGSVDTMTQSDESGGFWRPRKSGESTRSKITLRSVKSNGTLRSTWSRKKGRKSEDEERMEVDEAVPPVPDPVTPRRSRRMLEGLAKSLGLTPRKKKALMAAAGEVPDLPQPVDRAPPRKSSFSSLRSALVRKTSTGTLKSTKPAYPFTGQAPEMDCGPPPLPPHWREVEGCFPSTPKGRRTPKTSIGAPRLQPSTSPSLFLKDTPRKAPGTPKDDEWPSYLPPMPELSNTSLDSIFSTPLGSLQTPQANEMAMEDPGAVEVISFSTPLTAKAAKAEAKPKRLIDLLPLQQRLNLGLQTPPSSRERIKAKQSTGFGPAKTKIGANGLPTPDYSPSVKSTQVASPQNPSSRSEVSAILAGSEPIKKRTPFAPVSTNRATSSASQSSSTQAKLGLGRPTGPTREPTPSIASHVSSPSEAGTFGHVPTELFDTFGTFGNTPPLKVKPRSAMPDFTASPETSFNASFDLRGLNGVSLATVDVDGWRERFERGMGKEWRNRFEDGLPWDAKPDGFATQGIDDSSTEGSHVPTEEWELEEYLKQLESVDGHSEKEYHGLC